MGHTTLGTLQISSSGSRPKASSAEKPGQEVQPQSRVKATPWQLAPNRWHPQRHPPPVPPPTWSQVSLPPPSPAQAPLPAPSSFVLHRSKPQTGQPALRPQAGPAGLPVPRASTPPGPWGGPRGLGQGWQVRGTRATERPCPTLAMPGTCWMTEPTGRGHSCSPPDRRGAMSSRIPGGKRGPKTQTPGPLRHIHRHAPLTPSNYAPSNYANQHLARLAAASLLTAAPSAPRSARLSPLDLPGRAAAPAPAPAPWGTPPLRVPSAPPPRLQHLCPEPCKPD